MEYCFLILKMYAVLQTCSSYLTASPGIATLSWWRGLHGPVIPGAIPSGSMLLVGSPMAVRSRGRLPDKEQSNQDLNGGTGGG